MKNNIKNELPKFDETFIPILEVLKDKKVFYYKDLLNKVKENNYSNLSEDLLNQKTKTGANTLIDRIGWGKTYLKQGNFISYPERSKVQITEKGLNILKTKEEFRLKDLVLDKDFITHRMSVEKNKSESEKLEIRNDTPQDLIDEAILKMESKLKTELLDKLKSNDPYDFEEIVLKLLKKMGYGDYIPTQKSRDGGIDGIINQDQLGINKIYIQSKRYSENKVREIEIRNFIGAMSGDTDKGIFVTTSSFDNEAIKKAANAKHTLILIDGLRLVELMIKYNIGVQIKDNFEIKEIDLDFFEEE